MKLFTAGGTGKDTSGWNPDNVTAVLRTAETAEDNPFGAAVFNQAGKLAHGSAGYHQIIKNNQISGIYRCPQMEYSRFNHSKIRTLGF